MIFLSNPVKPQVAMTKNGQPFYPLTTIDQVLDSGGNRLSADSTIQVYTHTKTNNVHNFVGTGANGRAKITADFVDGDTFAVNGTAVTAYSGSIAPNNDIIVNGHWVTFIYDGTQLDFTSSTARKALPTFTATLLSSAWTAIDSSDSTQGYTQTVGCTSVDGGGTVTENTQLGGPMARPTGVKATDKAQKKALNIINDGITTPGAGTVTVKVWKQPSTDITVYWYGG